MIQPKRTRTPRVQTAKERLGNIGRIKAPAKPKIKSLVALPSPVKLQGGGSVSRETDTQRLNDEFILLQGRIGDIADRGKVFQAARRLGLAEFDFKDPVTSRMGRFHTRMAGEPDPNVQRGFRLPRDMKLEDLYRDPAKEQPMRDLEAEYQAIDARLQQELRDIELKYETADKRDLQQYTSDMVPFETNQRLRGEAERDLENLREFERREAIQAAMQEAEEPERVRLHNEIQQLRAQQQRIMKAIQNSHLANLQAEIDESEEGVRQQTRAKFQGEKDMYAREQAALQREIDENEKKVLQEWAAVKRKEQALEPVYPEAVIPVGRAAVSTGQGLARLIDRLFRGSRPKAFRREEPDIGTYPPVRRREEPDIGTYPPVRDYAKGGDVAAVSMTRSTDRGPRTNVLSDAGMSTLDFMKGMKAGETPKTQDTARAQLDDVLRQLKVRERAVQDATRGMARNTFGAPTLEQPTLTKGSLTKRRFAEGGDVSRETISPEEQPVTEESSASRALKRLIEPVREGAKGFLGMEPTEPMNPSEVYKALQALGNMPGPAVVKGAAKAAMQVPGLLEGITTSIFIGPRAANWNKATNKTAQAMEKAGASPQEIWSKTMNFRAPDGKWRQEISDVPAAMKQGPDQGHLEQFVHHPELYKNYPDLQRLEVAKDLNAPNSSYSLMDDSILLNQKDSRYAPGALHEVQHAVQTRENFAMGGNPEMAFKNKEAFDILKRKRKELGTLHTLEEYAKKAWQTDTVTPEVKAAYRKYLKWRKSPKTIQEVERAAQESAADEYYMRLHGEAEARAVSSRKPLDMEQRRQLFPLESYTRYGQVIPPQDLIIKRKEGGPVNKHDAFIKAKA